MRRPQPEKPGPGQESVWDYPRPPRVEAVPERIRVVAGGILIADTTRAMRVLETSHPPVYYVPRDDVRSDLAAGNGYACGLAVDSSLVCTGTITGTPTSGTYRTVSAFGDNACAVTTEGTTLCWGASPPGAAPVKSLLQVATGGDFACGIAADGTLACWGADADVTGNVPAGTFGSVTAADTYACAIATDGTPELLNMNSM